MFSFFFLHLLYLVDLIFGIFDPVLCHTPVFNLCLVRGENWKREESVARQLQVRGRRGSWSTGSHRALILPAPPCYYPVGVLRARGLLVAEEPSGWRHG